MKYVETSFQVSNPEKWEESILSTHSHTATARCTKGKRLIA